MKNTLRNGYIEYHRCETGNAVIIFIAFCPFYCFEFYRNWADKNCAPDAIRSRSVDQKS